MTNPVISVENLSKAYRIGVKEDTHDTLLAATKAMLRKPWQNFRNLQRLNTNRDQKQDDTLWAVKDVSFEVQEGEVIGVIGKNGAGKSTLLKILSRITEPTQGQAIIRGRVSSLLEVGTGFHPELTGRDNIYMNGTILGMTKREIDRKFEEIVEFSGIQKFLDTPTKRYSSGMQVRLAFAVAAHLEPEVLIIDEVLAVGDAEFQKRCLGKMKDVAACGRTVLFVSHNMQAVSTLTSRCILLYDGKIDAAGEPSDIIRRHLDRSLGKTNSFSTEPHPTEPRVVSAHVDTSHEGNVHVHGRELKLSFEVSVPTPVRNARFSFQLTDNLGRPVLHLWTFDSERPMCRTPGTYFLECTIPRCRLYLGQYRMTIHFGEGPGGLKFQTEEGLCPFEVVMYDTEREGQWYPGTCTYIEDATWQVESASA